MKTLRAPARVLGIALFAAVMSASGSSVAADAAIDPEVLAAREAAWRAFYEGDVKTLGDQLPEDFIGINMNDGPFTNRGSAERTMRGRLTEMFVRRDGKWLHPGWHLDLVAAPAPSRP